MMLLTLDFLLLSIYYQQLTMFHMLHVACHIPGPTDHVREGPRVNTDHLILSVLLGAFMKLLTPDFILLSIYYQQLAMFQVLQAMFVMFLALVLINWP